MNIPRTSRVSALASMVVAVSLLAPAVATAIPLSALINVDGVDDEITVGDKRFYNWTADNVPDTWAAALNVEGIFANTSAPGLSFDNTTGNRWRQQANANNGNATRRVVEIAFDVEVLDPDFLIKDNELDLVTWTITGTGGNINIKETAYELVNGIPGDALFTPPKEVDADLGPLVDSRVFAPQKYLHVVKTITLTADSWDPNAPNGLRPSIRLDSFYQRFSQVPEPATLAILGLGLAGLGLQRRRLAAK